MRALGLGVVVVAALAAGSGPAVADDDPSAESLYRAGKTHFDAGRFREALADYQAAHEREALPALIFNIAQCHRNLGEYGEAAAAFRRYLAEQPGDGNAAGVNNAVAQLDVLIDADNMFRQRRYGRALERYREAQKVEPLATIHRDLARAHEQLGDYDAALAAYESYLAERDPAEDRDDIEESIARLQVELAGPARAPVGPAPEGGRPIYKKWWFWTGVAAVVVSGAVIAFAASDGIPGSDLGNVSFDR